MFTLYDDDDDDKEAFTLYLQAVCGCELLTVSLFNTVLIYLKSVLNQNCILCVIGDLCSKCQLLQGRKGLMSGYRAKQAKIELV